ncbi:hypothetical protein DMC25_06505 [Caulobacter sp. D4A]|uniref:hypothetical protein n=1 Tax=unclassified Caulobacter TaxID=2648921 RepID=UPI000D73F78C|nr:MULTISPECIES: hypothetical protein [unclassified Caulobacter]PXA91200.1 hypothetical protein DMC25_06505 [Caulobacter sp. D4A]PXA96779.1 hypothetical protein DMC18_00515 [Caulobacter sp. D5]
MTNTFTGLSQFRVGASLPAFSQEEIAAETMLFSASPRFAYDNGGPITRAFLEAVNPDIDAIEGVLDTRVHMLMRGMWPCIPGWHLDDVPRTRPDGQPDLSNPDNAQHVLALIGGEVSPTEFAVGTWSFPEVPVGSDRNVWDVYDEAVTNALAECSLVSVYAPSNRLVWFDSRAFHRGTSANAPGWRWFGRLSNSRAAKAAGRKPRNQIRSQVQVYLQDPRLGW